MNKKYFAKKQILILYSPKLPFINVPPLFEDIK